MIRTVEQEEYKWVLDEGDAPPSVLNELQRQTDFSGRYYECTTFEGWWRIDRATKLIYRKEWL